MEWSPFSQLAHKFSNKLDDRLGGCILEEKNQIDYKSRESSVLYMELILRDLSLMIVSFK